MPHSRRVGATTGAVSADRVLGTTIVASATMPRVGRQVHAIRYVTLAFVAAGRRVWRTEIDTGPALFVYVSVYALTLFTCLPGCALLAALAAVVGVGLGVNALAVAGLLGSLLSWFAETAVQ
jgi:hypothetical protein